MIDAVVLPTCDQERHVWVEVDEDQLVVNTRVLRRWLPPDVAICGVVKANGYGHGLARAARAFERGGAARLVVATIGEGVRARAAGVHIPIVVTGPTHPTQLDAALAARLELSVESWTDLEAVARRAAGLGKICSLHLGIDTGMHRLGVFPEDVGAMLEASKTLPGIRWVGAFTHFACADQPDHPLNAMQERRFHEVIGTISASGWQIPLLHAANSAATLTRPQSHFDAVRLGLALYGMSPLASGFLPAGLRPALRFCTTILRVATLPAGSPVSYGATYRTQGVQRIATLGAGYADGLRRSPPWREVLIHGQRAPIVGRICMDYAMVDVTHIPEAQVDDEVVLLGAQGDGLITADEVAGWFGTIPYDVLTTISS